MIRTFGPFTFTQDKVSEGKLDESMTKLKNQGWEVFSITTAGISREGVAYFLHCRLRTARV